MTVDGSTGQGRSVLITGGAGFVGQSLVRRCLEAGCAVSVLDNFRTGRREHLTPFVDRIVIHEGDILDAPALRAAMEARPHDIVFHLAAMHFIPWCNQHPQETFRINVEGSYAVLSAAARVGVRMCVLASTGAIYPSRDEDLSESLPAAPGDVYALTKHLMEETARAIGETSTMRCVAARLFNVYGPHETNQHLIPDILDFLRAGDVLHLGNVRTRRDYVYVDDVAAMLFRLGVCSSDRFKAVNVGTGLEYSAEDIVRTIERLRGVPLQVVADPQKLRASDKMHQRADVSTLKALVGARPETSLEDGLLRLLRHEGLLPAS